jgi:RNA polymerase sigma-70 factor (ECF subfamily)
VHSEAGFDAEIAAARAGRADAWDRLYRRYAPAVTGYLRMQGAPEPDDVASETFLGVFRGIARFEGDEPGFRSWVFTIAHRRMQDDRRARSRRPRVEAHGGSYPEPRVAGADDEVEQRLATERVQALCAQLAPDQRDVILLRILGDLTVEQVAAVLGKTSGAVKQLQRRGFEAVRRLSVREGVPL